MISHSGAYSSAKHFASTRKGASLYLLPAPIACTFWPPHRLSARRVGVLEVTPHQLDKGTAATCDCVPSVGAGRCREKGRREGGGWPGRQVRRGRRVAEPPPGLPPRGRRPTICAHHLNIWGHSGEWEDWALII